MNISNSQIDILRRDVRAGLRALFRPEPQTAVEWADASYYLPKESAYQEGRWETLPFQRAIMNAMGSDYIREVNVVKSARVGYSKMLLGVYAYFIEHKQRNTLIWLPTDGDAENFMKTHVEPTIRDIPSLLSLAPWYGKKHRDNTLTMKRFTNGRGFWCLGGKAAKNYREKSVDVAGYDELAAFDEDIEQEGSPTFLGDKRIEGSVWPKSIRGSTPKVRGTCQIERAASESPHFMRFHVACPHCGEEQYLKFGDKETPFGLKWTPDDPSSVFYLCEHNACVIRQQELDFTDARYICEKTGIWTRDGILWFSSSGEEIEPPDSVTFHIWTAYSPFTTWVQIVKDWMKTNADTSVRTISLLPAAGEAAAQGWSIKDGGIQLSDGVFKITKQSNKTWSLTHPVDDAITLLTQGGRLTCKFRLSGALTNNQFGLGIYLYTDAPVPDGVAMTGTGNPFLMSYFTQTTDGRVNLMHHRKAGNTKLGEFGDYGNDWQTLELVFTAGSATVTPKLNGVAGPAFQVIKDSLTLGLNALTLTDVTKNAAYGVEIESLVLEINAPASS
ncbi:phage terminase large subunit family protein [Escherichia coli]